MGRVTDETGNRYGRLTVVRRDPENAYHKGANWICRCDCGGERVASGIGLRQGMVKSCGCLVRERRILRCACGYKGQKTRNWTPDWKCYRCSGLSPLAEPPKLTEDELFEKRVEHWRYYHRSAPTSASHDVMLFLERLEKAERERDETRERNADLRKMLEQTARDRDHIEESLVRLETQRDEAQWHAEGLRAALALVESERDEARADVERLRREHEEMFAELRDLSKKYDECDAFKRGAEAMRDAAFEAMLQMNVSAHRTECAEMVRALPIPEEP